MQDEINLELGPDIIRSYKRLGYRAWYALAEFLDNSTQSFFDNREALEAAPDGSPAICEIDVTYDRNAQTLRIHDTAMGMSLSELRNAVRLGKPPAKTTGRSEFGLGLKTAACWFGDEWTVTTKKLGETAEIEITVDVERIAAGDMSLKLVVRDKPPHLHYTTVEISKLHRPLHHTTIRRIQTHLRSMYRVDLREGTLVIRFEGGKPLMWEDSVEFVKDVEGTPYKRDFDIEVEGRRVWGWIGVMMGGGRTKAGFAQIRRGRVIQGQPDAWRPEGIFGVDRNDMLNQRLTGEINLDAFGISHTKDAILWQGNEEEVLENYLKAEFGNYIAEANKTYKSQGQRTGPSNTDVQVAVDELKSQLQSTEFVDAIQLTDVPAESVIKASVKHVVDAVGPTEPDLRVTIGDTACRVYLSHDLSPGDPYFASDTAGDIIVSINCNHAHWGRISGPDAVFRYLLECVYDAIAEWKCSRKSGVVSHDTIKWLKDGLLRLEIGAREQDGTPPV